MIFSSSPTIGSGVLFFTGYMPTDCPCSQSTSKLRTVSSAAWRSLPVPSTIRSLPVGSVRMAPGREAKPSNSFDRVVPETYCTGMTVMPYPGSTLTWAPCAIDRADAAVVGRHDFIARSVAHHVEVVGVQRVLEHEQHVLLGDRPPGGESDRALRMWIDDIAYAEDVAEHRFGDVRNRSILEIERVAPSCSLELSGSRAQAR